MVIVLFKTFVRPTSCPQGKWRSKHEINQYVYIINDSSLVVCFLKISQIVCHKSFGNAECHCCLQSVVFPHSPIGGGSVYR